MQQGHVGPPVAQQPFLLAGPAPDHVDRDRVRFAGLPVEQIGQQFRRPPGFGDQDQRGRAW
jgi:hypothetical protein